MSSVIRRLPVLLAVWIFGQPVFAEEIEFNRDIRPILSEKCFFCHGPDANHREADLRLDIETDAKDHAIVEGHADQSELYVRVTTDDADELMPPPESGKSLTAAEVERLRLWIAQGARYDSHWAFVSPERAEPPEVSDESWIRNSVDRFTLARLDAADLKPSAQADRAALIRRLSLDLTGLPPTVEEVKAFVSDPDEGAYEKVVDRLLQSSRFGEHMARYWMDAARYADTNGYQYDLEREQWVWRDWVINAFNTNMPYDQFTLEQLAGDLLPEATEQQQLATGFHRNHPITIEGGVIDEEYRTEYVVDRVVTTSTVWLGLTMTCSRCHDHKYDPLSQRDFYQFFAYFNNAPEKGLNGFAPKIKVASPFLQDQLQPLEQRVAVARAEFEQVTKKTGLPYAAWERQLAGGEEQAWKVLVPEQMKSAGGATLTVQDDQSVLATDKNPANETYEVVLRTDAPHVSAVRLEALVDPSTVNGGAGRGSNGNFVLSEFEVDVASAAKPDDYRKVELSGAEADYSQNGFDISLAIDGAANRSGWAVDGNTKIASRSAVFLFEEPVGAEAGTLLRIRMIHRYGASHHIARFRLSICRSETPPLTIKIAAVLEKPAAKRTAAETELLQDWLLTRFGGDDVKQAAGRLRSLERERKDVLASFPETMVMTEMPSPRKTHILLRGEYDKPGDEVQPGTPAVLPPMPEGFPRNRLGLAQWLLMPSHPLTARVAVNRLWQQLFGAGIVKTVEDFGAQGDWPSHPQLLDWLAVEFVESGWDVKSLLKQIVMSATYQQSGALTAELLDADPQNRLFSRGPRLRLDAEVIRDSALFAAGLLSPRVGGPSVFPYQPAGLWQEINNRPGYSRTYKVGSGESLYRRSLYTFWKRTLPPPSMAAFDAPEREFCMVRRSRTNTPLQAFVMLHDPQFVEAARHLAVRILREGGANDGQRIDYGFRLCHSREPTDQELEVLGKTLEERFAMYRADVTLAEQVISVGDSETDPSLDAAELAAWTTVSRVLLNLSEFVTKP